MRIIFFIFLDLRFLLFEVAIYVDRLYVYNGFMGTKKARPQKTKSQGNIYDAFVKRMFGQLLVFMDFLLNYADKKFVAAIK